LAETVSTNQFKNGMHVELDGQVWRIVEFQHVKPGKGGAFVRTKLKNLDSGSVVDRTFRAGEKMPRVRTETKSVQYLYDAGDEVVFMDTETYDQVHIAGEALGDSVNYLVAEMVIQVEFYGDEPVGIELPQTVDLLVKDTVPAIKGATASAQLKPATLETGLTVLVPPFIAPGDKVRVNTETGEYQSRA